ncbi:MAG: ATP-binding protein, partial [Myxococcota bacterium]
SVQRDITARIEAAEETERQAETLREARDAAERATKAKSAFLATRSHEIRTPLNGIIGMTSLLQGTELSSEQRDFVSTIRASGDTLLTVINDILDFSKIEAGQVELELQPFELVECLESALELVCVAARRKGVGLQYVMGPGVPERVEGDITRLRQVLVNLLGNAVKFTGEGHVVLRVLAGDAPDQLHFRVEDTGIGIPKERRARLFKAFSQVDASITRRFGGTGLGLAICRQLVERMGGAIDVESEDGKGSTFFFDATLPARPASPDLLFRDAQRAFGGQRVGVALGWEPSDAFAAELLRRVGAEVVRDPAAPVDVAFVAAESGWGGVAARVLPVRLSAAAASSPTELELPLRRFTFFRHVLPRLGHELSAEGSGAAHQAAECSLRVLLAEDNAVNQKVATKLLQRLGITPDVASNGAEAVELVHQARYDLILMDMQMPVMDGLQATRTIRESGLDPQPRILALTANAMPEDRKRCLDAGMDGFLAKPLRLETLRKAVLEPTPSISPAAA